MFYFQTRSSQIFKLLLSYDTGINRDIYILIVKLNKVLVVLDCKRYNPKNIIDKKNLLVFFTNLL